MKPTISAARKLAEAINAHQVIVIAFDNLGHFACVSYGKTERACHTVAPVCDAIAFALERGEIAAPRKD